MNGTPLDSDKQASFLTDALVERHKAETAELPAGTPPIVMREHATRQARELLAHAYDLEKRLHEMWQKYRWT